MKDTSNITRNRYYNLFQNLKMSPMRPSEEDDSIPEEPGAYLFWLDEAPPQCLLTGIVPPKAEGGLKSRIGDLVFDRRKSSELHRYLQQDKTLAREYGIALNDADERTAFIQNNTYCQYLKITDMKDDELILFDRFIEDYADLHPRYKKYDGIDTARKRKK
jgi:hypothetical protein